MWRIPRWLRTKTAIYYLAYALKQELNEEEFKTIMGWLLRIFDGIDWICDLFNSLFGRKTDTVKVALEFKSDSGGQYTKEARFKRTKNKKDGGWEYREEQEYDRVKSASKNEMQDDDYDVDGYQDSDEEPIRKKKEKKKKPTI